MKPFATIYRVLDWGYYNIQIFAPISRQKVQNSYNYFECSSNKYLILTEAFRILDKVDKSLHKLNSEISFKGLRTYTHCIFGFLSLIFIFPVYNNFVIFKSVFTQISESIAFGTPVLLMLTLLYFWSSVCTTIYNRFVLINYHITQINSEKCTQVYLQQKIHFMSKLHQQLCKSVKCVTESSGCVLLVVYFLFLVFFTVAMLIFSVFSKNTLLLQLSHEKIEFTLCGLFDLNLNKLLQSIGSTITVVMFLLQVQKISHD
ncbi:uncharacterized protein LOC135126746 [Zophobas morio]|uniref:uncharacterized protein LOC135126746 n=1 Tax=Zophobas morio TaxID=2755281 RepID=UPI0030827DFD